VEQGGKLFEREKDDRLVNSGKRDRQNKSRPSTLAASFCPRHGNRRVQGAFRSARAGFFCYFFARQRKVKITEVVGNKRLDLKISTFPVGSFAIKGTPFSFG